MYNTLDERLFQGELAVDNHNLIANSSEGSNHECGAAAAQRSAFHLY